MDSSALTTQPIQRICPRRTTTCSLRRKAIEIQLKESEFILAGDIFMLYT
jgi:hypothetical protein